MFILDRIPELKKLGLPPEIWLIIEDLTKLPRPFIKEKADYLKPWLFRPNLLGENYFNNNWFTPHGGEDGDFFKYYYTVQTIYHSESSEFTATLKTITIGICDKHIIYTTSCENLPIYFIEQQNHHLAMLANPIRRDYSGQVIEFSRKYDLHCSGEIKDTKNVVELECLRNLWKSICFGTLDTASWVLNDANIGTFESTADSANAILILLYWSCVSKNPKEYEARGFF